MMMKKRRLLTLRKKLSVLVLSKECGDDIFRQNVVEKTCDEALSEKTGDTYEWMCFDFKERRVSLNAYSIRNDVRRGGPYEWVMEGSQNGCDWVVLDEKYTNWFEHGDVVLTVICETSRQEGFRYIRMRQTGPNTQGNSSLNIGELELFGTLSRE